MTTTNLGRVAVVPKGTWAAGTYKALDMVRYQGSSYIAKTTTTALPTVTTDWDLVASDGSPSYTWVKYASDATGTGLTDSPTGMSYIGIAVNKSSATESTTATDYTWSLIKGDKGDTGATGPQGPAGTNGTGTVNSIIAGTGLSGGTITTTGTIALADTTVTAGNYTTANITVDAQGRITAAANGTGGGTGTVTSVEALTITTTGTDITSSVANSTSTPVITINIPNASAAARGVLTAADWSTFNGKQAAITFGTGVLTFIGTPSSANLKAAVTDETGSGALVFATSPTLVTPVLGTPTSGILTSCTGLPLTTGVTGTLPIANGGTGATTLAGAGILTGSANNTFTGTQTFNGTSSTLAAVFANAAETTTVAASAATGTIAYYTNTQSVLYYTASAAANWTLNLTHSSGTTLNTAMAVGQCVTVTFLVTNGATAYYNSVVQVDGTTTGVTTKWQGGTAPTSGNASAIDVYTYAIIKTAAATFTVLASITKFA